MAQKTHFGEDFASYSIPTAMQTRYPRLGSDMASPLPQSRRGRSGSRTFSSKIRRCTRCAIILPLALVMMSCTLALWYFPTFEKDLLAQGTTTSSAPTGSGARNLAMSDMCSSRASSIQPVNRAQCTSMLSSSVEEEKWLVGVHIDRAPFTHSSLRGTRQRRDLPHQYFVRAAEAILYTISLVDPGAGVFIVVFSEGRWGGMVDETGLPVDWDIPSEICDEVGLSCKKVSVRLGSPCREILYSALPCIRRLKLFREAFQDLNPCSYSTAQHSATVTVSYRTVVGWKVFPRVAVQYISDSA